jgi:hypothetical protein
VSAGLHAAPIPGAPSSEGADRLAAVVIIVEPMVARMIIGLGLTVIAFAVAGRRVWWLAFSGQPAPERVAYARSHPGREAETQLTEVIGQRKLLKWTVPGAVHAAVFWGFIILIFTIIEAYGDVTSKCVCR